MKPELLTKGDAAITTHEEKVRARFLRKHSGVSETLSDRLVQTSWPGETGEGHEYKQL